MARESAWRHPDPPVQMPQPRSGPPSDWEEVPEEDALREIAQTTRPGHKDNRGMSPALHEDERA